MTKRKRIKLPDFGAIIRRQRAQRVTANEKGSNKKKVSDVPTPRNE